MQSASRISLSDNFQFKMFAEAMNTWNHNRELLTPYDREFYTKMRDGWNWSKRDLTLTVKQMNHLTTVAAAIKGGTYD